MNLRRRTYRCRCAEHDFTNKAWRRHHNLIVAIPQPSANLEVCAGLSVPVGLDNDLPSLLRESRKLSITLIYGERQRDVGHGLSGPIYHLNYQRLRKRAAGRRRLPIARNHQDALLGRCVKQGHCNLSAAGVSRPIRGNGANDVFSWDEQYVFSHETAVAYI